MQNMGIEVLFKGINSLRLWQGLWVTIRTVSYTHLDVYKRQALSVLGAVIAKRVRPVVHQYLFDSKSNVRLKTEDLVK